MPRLHSLVKILTLTCNLPSIDTTNHCLTLRPPLHVPVKSSSVLLHNHGTIRVKSLLDGNIDHLQRLLPNTSYDCFITQSLSSLTKQPRSFNIMPVGISFCQ